jgi:hypothetical protein
MHEAAFTDFSEVTMPPAPPRDQKPTIRLSTLSHGSG